MGFPNPAIAGSAITKALGPDQTAAANRDGRVNDAQAALDRADLRELEGAEYYGDVPPATEPARSAPRRSLLDRLLRR
jgi:hypothetical protein